jgi:hypothetical protein
MRTLFVFGLGVLLLCGLSGCGGDAEAGLKECVATMNDIGKTLEGVKDEASADAALPQVEKKVNEFNQQKKRWMRSSSPKVRKTGW